jgi:diadenosine tetraphosphate (Ap4A) HIT family hydrolase
MSLLASGIRGKLWSSIMRPFDIAGYTKRVQEGPCFICGIVAGTNPHHMVYEDPAVVAFLNKYPSLYGYVLVAPRDHREQATGDFALDEYLALQRVIYHVAEAIRHVVPTERIYILTLGSQQGNRHVHWHVAPLPPGVPYEQQQTAALDNSKGILALSDREMAALAQAIREELKQRGMMSAPNVPMPEFSPSNTAK